MRALLAIAGAAQGGAEAHFVRLAVALQRAGLEQRVIVRSRVPWTAALRAGGIEPLELPFGGSLDLRTHGGLRRAISEFRPDIVLSWVGRAARFCPPAGAARPFIHIGRPSGYHSLRWFRKCDYVIGATPHLVDYFVTNGIAASRAMVIPNFIVDAPAAPLDRAALDTPAGATLLVGLGRLHRNKGFDVLLGALRRLDGAYLWLAGDGPLRPQLAALASALGVAGRVRFLGWRDDVGRLLATADIFVCPSRREPFGSTILEAWAQRVPIVAAASEGPTHLIEADRSGLLVAIDDAYALAAAVRRLAAEPQLGPRLAAAGRAAFEADYTEAAVVPRYLQFFEQAMGACAA